jgi:hypothetical protein
VRDARPPRREFGVVVMVFPLATKYWW